MIPPMKKVITHWSLVLLALFVFGPIAGRMVATLRAPDGGPDATPLVSSQPAMGLVIGIAAMFVAVLPGLLAARLVGLGSGLGAAGLGLAWVAWRTGTVDELLRRAQSASPLWTLAVEGLIFGVLAVLLGGVLVVASGEDRHEVERASDEKVNEKQGFVPRLAACLINSVAGPGAAFGLLVAVIAGALAGWLVAQEPLKGQCVAAGMAAGLAAAVVGRIAEYRTPTTTIFLALAVLATVGPLTGALLQGNAERASQAGTLFALSYPVPLDWIAGGLLGIPIGTAWASSMLEKRVVKTA